MHLQRSIGRQARGPLAALAILLGGLGGCAEPAIANLDAGSFCVNDSDCPSGQTCQRGVCLRPSGSDGGIAFDGGALPDAGAGGRADGGGADGGGGDGGSGDGGTGAGFGEACANNASCRSGICIQSTSLGSVCSKFCSEDCPIDWGCKVVQVSPTTTASVCFPGADLYCVPCTADACASTGDHCTRVGEARYCTRDCTASGLCPTGFECLVVAETPEGYVAPPADGGTRVDGGLGADAGAVAQCIPVSRLCPGCIDADRDGYGIGAGCLGTDCDDQDPTVHPGAPEVCNGRDDNCDGQVDETFDLGSDNNHCGACNLRCNTAQGFRCCNGQCVQTSSDVANCGGCGDPVTGTNVCLPGQSCCGGTCVHTDTSLDHCGGCSSPETPRACASDGSQLCCGGVCRNIRVDDANCGGCGDSATGQNICRVVLGERCCAGACHNILTENAHCGGCNGSPRPCAAGNEACCAGVCTSVIDNDLACGACGANCTVLPGGNCCGTTCYDKLTDPQHCGDACIACAGSRPACCGGACTDLSSDPRHCGSCDGPTASCPAGWSCCDGTCRNLNEDGLNCGVCGKACALGQTCCGGQCLNLSSDPNNCGTTCGNRSRCVAPNATCCGGVCINTSNDNANCGGCGNPCNTAIGQTCCSGQCKNVQQGDVNNCGGCGIVCDLPNTATHLCSGGNCLPSVCDPGWYNLNGTASDGCECNQGPHEPNNSYLSAHYLGSFADNASGTSITTRIVPSTDVDWFRFDATDETDTLGCDDFRIRVTLSGLPTQNSYRLTVYRGAPPGSSSIGGSLCCCGFLCTGSCSTPASLSATSNGASSVTVSGWEDPSSLCGGCDNSASFYIQIEQVSGGGVCADITLTVRNG
jgi:hypothetical protein